MDQIFIENTYIDRPPRGESKCTIRVREKDILVNYEISVFAPDDPELHGQKIPPGIYDKPDNVVSGFTMLEQYRSGVGYRPFSKGEVEIKE